MRFVRELKRRLFPPPPYEGEIPPVLYRLHPALGARAVQPGQAFDDPPDWWHQLPDEAWEETLFDWLRELMRAVAGRGEGKLYIDFSGRRGLNELMLLPECAKGPRPASAICDGTPAAIDALLATNVSQVVQTVGPDVVLYVNSTWEGVFLCIEDADLLRRFGDPVPRSTG